ncbi:alpha-amylase [Haloprofundus marisrubri]|uniref:Alpha-amylase n=1 Tax=Haloprofundus marisrubri TaxID=1514971 RepID=A0A0W1RD25_9EURY|nr:alpha-amylase family glycosyl hydrolase [Haloprofundus marisrubri]KTG10940.1 alpha-amylase [Haloprofundus marisrubri]
MHHPGPPRFVSVGESVELAPRTPDPTGSYRWSVAAAPEESSFDAGASIPVGTPAGYPASDVDEKAESDETGPVVHFHPDVPGAYTVELDAPDGTHELTVRAFPDERHAAQFSVAAEELPVDESKLDDTPISVSGPFNHHLMATKRPRRVGDDYVLDVQLLPGEHTAAFSVEDDLAEGVRTSVEVEGPGRPRIRLDATVEDDEVVVTATPKAAPDSEFSDADLPVEFYLDGRDELGETDVTIDGRELRVAADALSDRARIHAVTAGERRSIGDTVVLDATGSDSVAVTRPNDPPAWAETPTVYEIFVRSFAGETLPTTFGEIERRVEYLQSLDVDCLWLTPVLASPTTHGYHITDYLDTASDLGSRAAFESLVDRCHDAGIKVVFDLVINHTSRDHPAFQMHAAGVDEYADHFRRVDGDRNVVDTDWASLRDGEDVPEYYFNWSRIPNVNYDSLSVRSWMLDVVDEWAGVVDGFRCDVAWGVSHAFWKEVRDRAPDDFLLLDETIPRDAAYHEGEFHMHYDTTLYETLRDIGEGEKPADAVLDALDDATWAGFPDSAVHLRYVENHDEDRYIDECDEASLRAAAAATFTVPGAPMIYYGQERGVPEQRGPMRWHDGDADLTAFHRALTSLRAETPTLREGSVEAVDYDVVTGDGKADADAVTAYAREDENGRYVVVLNFSDDPATVSLGENVESTDLLSGEAVVAGNDLDVVDAVVLRTA